MTNIYFTDSDEEVIVDFVKDHKELYDKSSEHVKDKSRKEFLWEKFAKCRKLSVKVCKTWFDSQRTRYGKLTESKSGQVPKEIMEHQTWTQDKKLGFPRSHIRCKGLSKSSAFKLQARGASASATTAHDISRASTDTDSMGISMRSTGTTLQPQHVTSPTAASGCSSVDQFTQMRTMLSSFLRQKQETTTCTAFYNYLASEVERLEEKDFQTFRLLNSDLV